MSNAPLVLVDGSSYLYRAFHALPPLTTSKGLPTGAVKGVLNMLKSLSKQYPDSPFAVVFDAKGSTFRDELFEHYKSHRPPMPDELRVQIEPLHASVRALGYPLLCVEGVEADDVIGTLAQQAAHAGTPSLISTGDKDLAQLVDGHITLVNTMSDTVLDRDAVIEKFGVPPERIVDYLALVGDSVDNIPGVPGVGPKTAAKWLQQYGSLDNVVAHAPEIGGKVGENLRASLEQLPLARKLATIRCDVALDVSPTDLSRRTPDAPRLKELFQRLEFKTWLAELGGVNTPAATTAAISTDASRYEAVLDEAALGRWIGRLKQAGEFAFDTETTDLDAQRAEIVGVSFTAKSGEAAYIPLAHRYPGAPAQLDRDHVLTKLKPLLEDKALGKIGQNLKYDLTVLANHGVTLRGLRYDRKSVV